MVVIYDNFNDYFEDMLVVGCYYNNEEVVCYLVEEGLKEINNFIENGMKFDGDEIGFYFGKEGVYWKCRILYVGGDVIGKNLLEYFI